jgi:hypothetical protein
MAKGQEPGRAGGEARSRGGVGQAAMKDNTGARWEITVDGRPRTYDHKRELAIQAAEYLKLKNPAANVTVRDLEGGEETIVIPQQRPRVRQ